MLEVRGLSVLIRGGYAQYGNIAIISSSELKENGLGERQSNLILKYISIHL